MRQSRHQMFMAMAAAASTRSTCFRLNVGAVVVYDRSVVSMGYNGAPRGEPHCTGNGCAHYAPAGCTVVHAEANALERVPGKRLGMPPNVQWIPDNPSHYGACEMYVTHSPCGACCGLIIRSRLISTLYYGAAYRDPTPILSLVDLGVTVRQLLPSGMMVDAKTGELCE